MNNIDFYGENVDWYNNADTVIGWLNSSSQVINWYNSASTNSIRYADFVRVTTPDFVYRFATTPAPTKAAVNLPLKCPPPL
jgi:hypothetical protein